MGGGAAGEVAEEADLDAEGVEGLAFAGVEGVEGVVTAFGVDLGADGLEEVGDAGVVEDGDVVDHFEGGEDFGAVVLGVDGARGAFEGADALVTVEGDEEGVTALAGLAEVADVAGVEEIKAAVGEDEFAAFLGELGGDLGEGLGCLDF